MYLLSFSIVLYRTIVTVYTCNIFLYNYLWQMHQIIRLSPVGYFTPARGKTVQKNSEVSSVKLNSSSLVGFRHNGLLILLIVTKRVHVMAKTLGCLEIIYSPFFGIK